MIVSSIREKLLLFKFRYRMTQRDICREIGISEQHFIRIMSGQYPFSTKIERQIELLFRRYEFLEALDDKKRL